ncbi:MAG TPA: GNAT family N-acetyltransferase [bacterium]|nr:GNAT family N-acetyltransferase [bacterium]
MTPAEILARFDAEMRIDPPPRPGVQYERVGNVVRGFGTWHAVVFARLTSANADAAIAEQVAFFHAIANTAGARAIEWKVYGHDTPADLGSRLSAVGFEPDEPETLMVLDLAAPPRAGDAGAELSDATATPLGIDIRRVTGAAGLADLIAAGSAAFGRSEAEQMARIGRELSARLGDPALSLHVAYAAGRPVAGARLECPPERSFAGLWGGGTIPEYRGRGIYRALVQTRAQEARRRGYRYLRVDARETSRPILERLGFVSLTRIIEWRLALPPQ